MTRVLGSAACGSLGGHGRPTVPMRRGSDATSRLGKSVGTSDVPVGDGRPRHICLMEDLGGR
jgi:hypothetical protein